MMINYVSFYKSLYFIVLISLLSLLSSNVTKAEEVSANNHMVLNEVVISNENSGDAKTNVIQDYKCVKKYKLAIFVPEELDEFNEVLFGLFKELEFHGFFQMTSNDSLLPNFYDENYYKKLYSRNKNSCISLVKQGFYNVDQDNDKREQIKAEIKERVDKKEITMLLGLGSIAGLDYAKLDLGIPVFISDAANPDKIGIIEPTEYPQKPNLFVVWYPNYADKNIETFHSLLNFKSLGVLWDENENYQKIQSYDSVVKLSKELGYSIHPCYGNWVYGTNEEVETSFLDCIDDFLDVDAVFLPVHSGLTVDNVRNMIDPLIDNEVKVFTEDADLVKKGVLISIFQSNIYDSGAFVAKAMSRVVNGEKLENISQIYNPDFMYALNIKTAKKVKWTPSFELLMQTEYLYDKW